MAIKANAQQPSCLSFLETYQEYKKVKSHLSGEEKKMKRVHFEDNIECQGSPPLPTQSKEDGVFSASLNKKPKKKMNGDFYVGGRREGEGERKSVWKLCRWSKSRGHHTVVIKKEEGREGEQRREENNKDMAGSGPSGDKASSEVCVYSVHDSALSMIIYNDHEIPLSISAII